MPRPKKGKARAQAPAPEDAGGEGGLAPIPEDPTSYEGYGHYGQGGETWQNGETAWPEGGAYDQGYGQGGPGPWGHQPGQTDAWDTGQYQQQDWAQQTTSPVNEPPPAGAAAFAAWSQNPQGAYGAARPTHAAAQLPPGPPLGPPPGPPSGPPPPGMPPSRPRQDSGMTAGVSSWQNWSAEAMANSRQFAPPPSQPYDMGFGQQGRVTFASHDSYVPFSDRAEVPPQAQRMTFDPTMSPRGGASRQPHQRSGRGSTQSSMHTTKQSKKSKKEKRAQEQSPPNGWAGQEENPALAQGNPGWEQDNSNWEKEGYGWGQQEAGWGEKQEAVWDQLGPGEAGRGDLDSEGYTDSDGWNDVTGRRIYRQTVSSPFVPAPTGNSPYPMPSRTMAYANGTAQDPLEAFSPGLSRGRNTIHDYANIEFLESYGEALKSVENAFFGRERKARDRIHWQFPYDKDERVYRALEWLHDNAHGVGAFGLNKFLQTRERGALFINASYDSPSNGDPALDWLTYEDVVETRDRLLQESVGFYDPAMQVIVFVFLPSKSGNSLAMWRRKVSVPNSVRLAHLREIDLAKAALRKDYAVLVDEMRPPPYRLPPFQRHSAPPTKKKKKGFFRRLFRVFKIVW